MTPASLEAKEQRIQQLRFRPLKYPQFFENWKLSKLNPWTVFELKFLSDKQDWINHMSPLEKEIIARALTAFTLLEELVGDYWSRIATYYTVPEIIMMCREFSSQESNHWYAYNYMEEVLDLDTFEQFQKDKEATQKIENAIDLERSNKLTSLAVFSGAIEGCSLFAIFALLVMFCRNNKMNTVKDILGWSAVDESLHSKGGIDLYHVEKDNLILKNIEYDWGKHTDDVIRGFDAVLKSECRFIDYVMPQDLPFVTKNDLKSYLYLLGNRKLGELGFESYIHYDVLDPIKAREIDRMMKTLTKGKSNSDFFNRKLSDSYTAVIPQDFTQIDYSKKRNLYRDFVTA